MKNLFYAFIIMVASAFYSCSVEEVDTSASYTVIDLNSNDVPNRNDSRTVSENSFCFKKPLMDANGNDRGIMIFRVYEDQVQVVFKTLPGFYFMNTHLSLEAWDQEEIDNINNALPSDGDFIYETSHPEYTHRVNHWINKSDLGMYSRLAARAVIIDDKDDVSDVWAGDWGNFILADFSECGTWPDKPFVSTSADVDFYAPLLAESSGEFPQFGSSPDTVTVNQDNPISEGYIDIPIVFANIPVGLKNAVISIDFTDLDLHTDTISSGNNVVEFSETFRLMDNDGKIIVELNENSSVDGDFTWTYEISDYMISPGEMQLVARVGANLSLVNGNGITATNTMEYMKNIKITGEVIIK